MNNVEELERILSLAADTLKDSELMDDVTYAQDLINKALNLMKGKI